MQCQKTQISRKTKQERKKYKNKAAILYRCSQIDFEKTNPVYKMKMRKLINYRRKTTKQKNTVVQNKSPKHTVQEGHRTSQPYGCLFHSQKSQT